MAPLASQRIRPGYQGVNSEAAPEYLRDGEAVYLENLLPGRDGKLVIRGSLTEFSTAQGVTAGLSGIWAHNGTGRVLYSYYDGSGDLQVRVVLANSTGFGSTSTVAGEAFSPAFGSAQIGDYAYGRTLLNPGHDRSIVQWDGTTSGFVDLTNGPKQSLDVIDHLERLFVLGGTVPGSASSTSNNLLFWSDAGGPTADTLDMWKDDASGLVNQLALRGQGDPGVALAKAGRNLAILRTSSIYLLTGQTPSSFAFQRVADRGCHSTASVVEYKDGFFFMSHDGFFFFDGVNTTEASAPIRSTLATFLRGPTLYQAYCTRLAHDYILVMMFSSNDPTGAPFAAIYHITSGAWTYLSADADIMPIGNPIQGINMLAPVNIGSFSATTPLLTIPLVWDGEKLWRAEDLVVEKSAPDESRGLDIASTAAPFPIVYKSRIARLATPQLLAQLHRVLLDHRYQFTDGVTDDSPTDGWQVSAVAGDGTELMAPTPSGALGTGSTVTPRQRMRIDVFTETEDAQVIITRSLTGNGAEPFDGEIHDVWIEHQPARQ